MAANRIPESGVYRFPFLIDGRPAFYTVDWHGVESDVRVVGDDERESDVIRELDAFLEATHPSRRRGGSSRQGASSRPLLRLL